jgi:hypothetical protein
LKEWSQLQLRYLHFHVYSSLIHNSQNMESAYVPISQWMVKQI